LSTASSVLLNEKDNAGTGDKEKLYFNSICRSYYMLGLFPNILNTFCYHHGKGSKRYLFPLMTTLHSQTYSKHWLSPEVNFEIKKNSPYSSFKKEMKTETTGAIILHLCNN
jgi:hypothetical protein